MKTVSVSFLSLWETAACVLPAPDEFQEEQARFDRESAKHFRASPKTLEGPPPRPIEDLRADATAKRNTRERLHDETRERLAELERNPNAGPEQRRYARNTADSINVLLEAVITPEFFRRKRVPAGPK